MSEKYFFLVKKNVFFFVFRHFLKLWNNKVYQYNKIVNIPIILSLFPKTKFIWLSFEPKLVFLGHFLLKLCPFLSGEQFLMYRNWHKKIPGFVFASISDLIPIYLFQFALITDVHRGVGRPHLGQKF